MSVSLDCPLVIALSVFSNVYLHCIKTLFGKSNLKILYEMRDLKKNKDVLLGNGMWRKYDRAITNGQSRETDNIDEERNNLEKLTT
jgi:hypothetical protein